MAEFDDDRNVVVVAEGKPFTFPYTFLEGIARGDVNPRNLPTMVMRKIVEEWLRVVVRGGKL